MQQNGLIGLLSLQIEIVVIGPPHRLPITTALSLPFSSVIAINRDTTPHPYEIQSKSRRTGRRWRDRLSSRIFKGDDFWPGGDGDEEGGKWKGWRRRRDDWKWRRRRRYPEKWTSLDAIWIFKILRPYGWSLPLILLSLLAASGPKAFFTSLALSFALSAAALVVQFLRPGAKIDSQGSDSKRKRRSAGRVSRSGMAGGRNDDMRNGQKRVSAYDSWLESDLDLGLDEPSFGGWIELGKEKRFPDDSEQVTGKQSAKRSRESLQQAEAETPLLLRLLVTMFPFLASWTKLFW